ncbi:galactokinase [Coemansia sp. RSA 2337]|nr:galactokinase [Coemansia sp. S3946]KAJ2036694.1 galactokinase [Coemansia sp. S16]KAJ2448801.1 galactokinase [Coemansia sp. RSA 2337]
MSSFAPAVNRLSDIYGADENAQALRYARLVVTFKATYGSQPEFIARAPGRVNIIGEHIDYCGFPVFPMAIAPDTLVAARANGSDRIRVSNMDGTKYPPRDFSVAEMFEIDSTKHEWSNYFKCGYRGVLDHVSRQGDKGFDALIDGQVPAGGGLSSSAAFVCATQLAVQRIEGLSLTQAELASAAAQAERHVGVNAGGMDQAVSIMGQQDSALFIEFHPALKATPVRLPEADLPFAFVIANTLVVSNKHTTAPTNYNLRVVETRVGALMLTKHLGIAEHVVCASAHPLTFKVVMDEYFAKPNVGDINDDGVQGWVERLETMLRETEKAFGTHPHGYTRDEMAAALSITATDLSAKIHEDQFPVRADRFKILQRAQHAFSEALRVVKFRGICEQAPENAGLRLGDLMNQSQDSCRDLFECSCPELDEICKIARQAGSFGSRLTGAGWGGCSVHLVPANKVDDVKKALAEQYYAVCFPDLSAEQLSEALFATKPGRGACYYLA